MLHSNRYALAALVGLAAIFSSCSVKEDIDITATAYNTEGQVIASHTLKDVPMKRNCLTVARGNFFTTDGSGTLSFLTDWDTEHSFEY